MTPQITQLQVMTEGQRKQIKRFLEDCINAIDFETFGFSKEEAQEIIEKGDLLQNGMKEFITGQLKKLAIIDKRFGAALTEFDVTLPMDYNHDTWLNVVYKAKKKLETTYCYSEDLNSKNYAKATNKLVPGKTYMVKIFPILERVSSEDCLNFLKKQRAILVGGQGLLLAQSFNENQFPKSKWTISCDEKEALWKGSDGFLQVPYVDRDSDGKWGFSLSSFEHDWLDGCCLLCFCDK